MAPHGSEHFKPLLLLQFSLGTHFFLEVLNADPHERWLSIFEILILTTKLFNI